MDSPRLIIAWAIFNLYVIADVLFTGGAYSTALAAWLALALVMARPWFHARREDPRAHP